LMCSHCCQSFLRKTATPRVAVFRKKILTTMFKKCSRTFIPFTFAQAGRRGYPVRRSGGSTATPLLIEMELRGKEKVGMAKYSRLPWIDLAYSSYNPLAVECEVSENNHLGGRRTGVFHFPRYAMQISCDSSC